MILTRLVMLVPTICLRGLRAGWLRDKPSRPERGPVRENDSPPVIDLPEDLLLKAGYRVRDEVRFHSRGQSMVGTIARLNPRNARVKMAGGSFYRVPYALLRHTQAGPAKDRRRTLKAVAHQARKMMEEHGLMDGWTFKFDDASRRGGCCSYSDRVISLAWQYCLEATEAERKNTVLHEIAHALVGPGHHHDDVWKAKAREIGCTADRCHNVEFAPPRYIAECRSCKWFAKSNIRRKRSVCRNCRGQLSYVFFAEDTWNERLSSQEWREAM